MHSSRMRTVRCSGRRGGGLGGVSKHALGRGVSALGGCLPGGCLPGGLSGQVGGGLPRGCLPGGGVWPGECLSGGCLPRGACLPHTPL